MSRALDFASSTDDACIVVDDYGFLALVALHFLQLEYGNWTHVNADGIPVALVQIDCDLDHDSSPVKVDGVAGYEVISSWFSWSCPAAV